MTSTMRVHQAQHNQSFSNHYSSLPPLSYPGTNQTDKQTERSQIFLRRPLPGFVRWELVKESAEVRRRGTCTSSLSPLTLRGRHAGCRRLQRQPDTRQLADLAEEPGCVCRLRCGRILSKPDPK